MRAPMSSVSTVNFTTALAALNPNQQLAVTTIEGPVMVLAGPGTGKTQVLAMRVAAILNQQDVLPENILALTFTDAAATTMRRRLVSLIGPLAYRVAIETFHSYAGSLLQQYPEYYPQASLSQPLTELERIEIMTSVLATEELTVLKPMNSPQLYLSKASQKLSELKREGVGPGAYEQLVNEAEAAFLISQDELNKTERVKQEKALAKQRELLFIYQEYQRQLTLRNRYDFDDMIMMSLEVLKTVDEVRLDQQEQLHYFLVDEYQDTNTAQNQLVRLLAENEFWDTPNLFVVGDPNQSIFRFQGATLENTLSFLTQYPAATVVHLEVGYRCPQPIYDVAHSLITTTEEKRPLSGSSATVDIQRFSTHLTSAQPTNSQQSILVHELPSQTLEIVQVAEQIKQQLTTGYLPEEIAVLYRNNADVLAIKAVFDQWQIPYQLQSGTSVFEYHEVRQLVTLLRVIHQIQQGIPAYELHEVLRFPWLDFDAGLVLRLGRVAGKLDVDVYQVILAGFAHFQSHDIDSKITATEFDQVAEFVKQLEAWADLDLRVTFPLFFELVLTGQTELVVDETVATSDDASDVTYRDTTNSRWNLLQYVQTQPLKTELLTALQSLFTQVKSLAATQREMKLGDFLTALRLMEDHAISIASENSQSYEGRVTLSTAHKAKGQEWATVYILHATERKWGSKKSREILPLPAGILEFDNDSDAGEDSRRLFYVAITRAKERVIISYPLHWIEDGRVKEEIKAVYLTELEQALPAVVFAQPISVSKEESEAHLARLLTPALSWQSPSAEAFLQQLLDQFVWSVTALNAYLRDENTFVENYLLRLPRAKPAVMAFGTAVHVALEKFYKGLLQDGETPSEQFLLDTFDQVLHNELLTTEEFKRRQEHGHEVLRSFFLQQSVSASQLLFIERFFGRGKSALLVGKVPITGRIDRVDWEDVTKGTVRVIDYKTGKAKSRNWIEGSIASAGLSEREQALSTAIRGPYKRQLLFYKLLADVDPTFKPTVTVGEFDFVEHGKNLAFELQASEVEELAQLLQSLDLTQLLQRY